MFTLPLYIGSFLILALVFFFLRRKGEFRSRVIIAVLLSAIVTALFEPTMRVILWVVLPHESVLLQSTPICGIEGSGARCQFVSEIAAGDDKDKNYYVLNLKEKGTIVVCIIPTAKVDMREEARKDAVLERYAYRFSGRWAGLQTPGLVHAYVLRIPKGSLIKQIRSEKVLQE